MSSILKIIPHIPFNRMTNNLACKITFPFFGCFSNGKEKSYFCIYLVSLDFLVWTTSIILLSLFHDASWAESICRLLLTFPVSKNWTCLFSKFPWDHEDFPAGCNCACCSKIKICPFFKGLDSVPILLLTFQSILWYKCYEQSSTKTEPKFWSSHSILYVQIRACWSSGRFFAFKLTTETKPDFAEFQKLWIAIQNTHKRVNFPAQAE